MKIKGLFRIMLGLPEHKEVKVVKPKKRHETGPRLNKFSKRLDEMLKEAQNDVVQNVSSYGKSTITINGKSYVGNNVTVRNNKVIVDGKVWDDKDTKEINITIDGSVDQLEVDAANQIKVNGNVNKLRTSSGDVEVSGNVEAGITTSSGDVEIGGTVGGNVKTMSGDVECGKVSGSVSSMSGDIN
jgi:hypothetical protein|tara:strand:- start:17252 stop:17806 length:555 start_codon:yes stop_codon:yes gene_type:complete